MSDDEITLNLFIMAFMGWNVTLCDEAIMDYVTSNKDCAFYKVKECFPENEYCLDYYDITTCTYSIKANEIVNNRN